MIGLTLSVVAGLLGNYGVSEALDSGVVILREARADEAPEPLEEIVVVLRTACISTSSDDSWGWRMRTADRFAIRSDRLTASGDDWAEDEQVGWSADCQ